MFYIFSKIYTIAKKKDAINGNDKHSAFVFTVFMVVCTVLWLAFKYAYKSTFLILICLFFWPNIKKYINEPDTDDPHDSKPSNYSQ